MADTKEKSPYTTLPGTQQIAGRLRMIKSIGGYKTIVAYLEEVTANDLRSRGLDPDTLKPLPRGAAA